MKILITEEQHKRIFLLEVGPTNFNPYNSWYKKLNDDEQEYVFDRIFTITKQMDLMNLDIPFLFKMRESLVKKIGEGKKVLWNRFEKLFKQGENHKEEIYKTTDEDGDELEYTFGHGQFLIKDTVFILDLAIMGAISSKAGRRGYEKSPKIPLPTLEFAKEYKHEIIDVLALSALFIPIAGPFISVGLEGINAALYFQEGDAMMGSFSLGLAVLPGGWLVRRALKQAKVLKYADEVVEWMVKIEKETGTKVTKQTLKKKLRTEITERESAKFYKANKSLLDNYVDNVLPKIGGKGVAVTAKKLNTAIKLSKGQWKNFLKNPEVFEKYMKMNGDDIYKAYLAYLLKIGAGEGLMGLGFYTIISAYGPGLVTDYKEWGLKTDAEAGNISSIVRQEGYDWEKTKQIFGVTPNSKNAQQNYDDNILLKQAWKEGWRPYNKNNTQISLEDGDPIPEKYQTDLYKKRVIFYKKSKEAGERLSNSAAFSPAEVTKNNPLTQNPIEFNKNMDWSNTE